MADQTLQPNDLTAQSMIAGPGMFPVQTAPVEQETPATPQLPPVSTGPMSEEPPQAQPGVAPEPVTSSAAPPPMPAATPPPTTEIPPVAAADDAEAQSIQNLKLEDIIDPTILNALRAQINPRQKTVMESIAEGIGRAGAEFNHPGAGIMIDQLEEKKKQDAMDTLTKLEAQLGIYKREALRQHNESKKGADQLKQLQIKQTSAQVAQTMKDAHALGVSGPIPPTAEQIEKDPTSVALWQDQMSQIIEKRRMRNEIISKQLPIYEKLSKDGSMDPKLINKSFMDMLTANGVDEGEKAQYYNSMGLMLQANAEQAKKVKDSYIAQRSAAAVNLMNMAKDRDKREARLTAAMAKGDMHAASMEMKGIEQDKAHVAQQIATMQIQIAAATAGETLQAGQPGYVPPGTAQSLNVQLQQLLVVQKNYEDLELAATDHMTKAFNAQNPTVAINDATLEAQKALFSAWPEAAKAPDLNQFLKINKNDPRAKQYYQSILDRCLTALGPVNGQLCADYIDQQNMKYRKKDALTGVFMQPSVSPNAGQPAAGK